MVKGKETSKPEDKKMGAESNLYHGDKLVRKYMYWSMGFGLIPAPLVDLIAISGTQLRMLSKLCDLYGVEFSENRVKGYIAALLGGMVPSTISMPVASLVKMIPIIGHTAGAVTMPAFAGASTYAVGQVFVRHFDSGGTLLDFDHRKAKDLFTEQFKEGEQLVAAPKKKEE